MSHFETHSKIFTFVEIFNREYSIYWENDEFHADMAFTTIQGRIKIKKTVLVKWKQSGNVDFFSKKI